MSQQQALDKKTHTTDYFTYEIYKNVLNPIFYSLLCLT